MVITACAESFDGSGSSEADRDGGSEPVVVERVGGSRGVVSCRVGCHRDRTDDNHTSAQFEHTVLVTDHGPEILTITTDGRTAVGTLGDITSRA